MKNTFERNAFSITVVGLFVLLFVCASAAREKSKPRKSLDEYLERLSSTSAANAVPTSPGSLWTDQGQFANLASDYKARQVGDLVRILVVQSLQSENTGNVATDRSFKASSGIDALAGHIRTSGVQNIFSPRSSQTLQGKAQASSTSSLRTSLTGRIMAVLPGGNLVVEAEREIVMNNERQTILVRGVVRPGDLAPDNSVPSNAVANLELEVKGKGVVSEGTRPPNVFTRWLLRLVGF
ncbi:MAG: flagellar biosynthesis protein FlgH [Acidobacteria bacterium]|nr:MAG: flagellar biosynthesis protein FlgH [Acidobacteriota bacterium]